MPRITDIQRIKDALTTAPGKKLYTARIAELLGKRIDLVSARLAKAPATFHVNKDGVVTFRRAPRKAKDQQAGQEQLELPIMERPPALSAGYGGQE